MKTSGGAQTLVWLALGIAAFLFLKWRNENIETDAWDISPLVIDSIPALARVDSAPKPFMNLRSPLVLKRKNPEAVIRRLPLRAQDGDSIPISVTAYCLNGRTRSGTQTEDGIVAADPRVFPLNREIDLQIEGRLVGRFRVEDTGLLIKGRIVDIWMANCAEARAFGRKRGFAVLSPKIRR
ncbi:MAG: 3D domain-containing protein [Gemmatimonadaceae bacterium]